MFLEKYVSWEYIIYTISQKRISKPEVSSPLVMVYRLHIMDSSTKRNKNFTPKEKELIINLALKYKAVIENKKTDALSLDEKKSVWEKLADEYNAISDHKRTAKQLKAFYKNSKSTLKKDIASDRVETFKTGGGTFHRKVDENNPLLAIVETETTPIENNFDSSYDYYSEEMFTSESAIVEDLQQECIIEEASLVTSCDDGNIPSSPNLTTKKSNKKSYSRKRKTNEEIQNYIDDFAKLKKEKLEAEIEKNKAKTKVCEKKLEILEAMKKEIEEKTK